MRGYFGIGVEGISKQYNIGNIFRSAHAFGASFVFTVSANYERLTGVNVDTSDSLGSLPFYSFPKVEDMILPKDCKIVGVEIDDQAIDLPSFRHPINATYIFGPERGNISQDMMNKCDYLIRIPSKFCLNVGITGAIVMYDRLLSLKRFRPRPVGVGRPTEDLEKHYHGEPKIIKESMSKFKSEPPLK